ncbi:MAG: low temperature requirement protein A [Crocosphaera sp.]|nr:low temperature requirement protein A [Crocosphaera sp.]
MTRQRSHPLRLHLGEERDTRHATWLELFFDLVLVLAIAELAQMLHSDLSWTGIASFAALFIPVWWLWIDFSYYADQFDINNGPYRLVMFGVMFGLVVMALTVPNALRGGSAEFATIYAALRLVIIILYVQAWRFVPQSRELTARYSLSFSVAFFLWLLSIAVPEPARFWLWAVALLIEISNGPITYLTIRTVPTQQSHMDERFGLFVIIVLGEAIIAVATGVSQTEWQWRSVLTGMGGFLTAVSLWWMYFERADESTIHQALRGGKLALLRSYIYGYSHVLAFMGIVATGVGIQFAIEAASGQAFMAEARTILCGGITLFLIGVTTLQWASPNSLPKGVIKARSLLALLAFCLIPLGSGLSPLSLVLLLSLSLVALNRFDGISLPTS